MITESANILISKAFRGEEVNLDGVLTQLKDCAIFSGRAVSLGLSQDQFDAIASKFTSKTPNDVVRWWYLGH